MSSSDQTTMNLQILFSPIVFTNICYDFFKWSNITIECGGVGFFFGIYGVVRHSNTRLKHISSFSTTLMSAAYRSTLSSQYHSAEIIYFLPIWRFIQKNLWSFEWFLCNVNKCCYYSQSCQLNNVWKWLMKKLVKTSHLEGTLLSR